MFSVPRDLKFKAILIPEPQKSSFTLLGLFEIQSDFDSRTSKIKFYSVRSLKCHLNEKNLIHSRVTATISKFSPQIFETYFNYKGHYKQ